MVVQGLGCCPRMAILVMMPTRKLSFLMPAFLTWKQGLAGEISSGMRKAVVMGMLCQLYSRFSKMRPLQRQLFTNMLLVSSYSSQRGEGMVGGSEAGQQLPIRSYTKIQIILSAYCRDSNCRPPPPLGIKGTVTFCYKARLQIHSCFLPSFRYCDSNEVLANNNMSEKINSPTTAPPPSEPNYAFLSTMNRNRLEMDCLNLRDLDQRIAAIVRKLLELHPNDQNQWREMQQSKIAGLARCVLDRERHTLHQASSEANQTRLKALKEHLRILVVICNKLKLEYNAPSITQTLKQLYFSEYGREIFPDFQKVGYSSHEFIILSGKEEPSSFFSFCCCSEEGPDT